MKKVKLEELTLREKIGQIGIPEPSYDFGSKDNLFGMAWSVGGLKMAFVNMDFTPRDDLVMKADEYIEEVKNINKGLKAPLLSGMDCTCGISGAFYEFEPVASAPIIGAANDEELAYEIGKLRALQLKRVGANWMWAPEVDLASRDSKIFYGRLYSDDPERMEKMALAEMKGCQSVGVAATVKHFPGADELEARDPHTSLQMLHISYEAWKNRQGKLFQKLFDEGVYSVMMSHSSFPAYDDTVVNGSYIPSSASYKIITELVKGEMGFKGVVVTDAVKMLGLCSVFGDLKRVYIETLKAGNDAILGVDADFIDVVYEAVLNGEISEERINDACQRVLDMKEKVGLFNDEANETLDSIEDLNTRARELNKKVFDAGVTLERNRTGLLPKKDIKNVGIIAITPQATLIDALKSGLCASFEKRGVKTTITRNLYSYDEIKKISDENDLIIYVAARKGQYKFFGVDERESYNFILHEGAEKSVGVSFGDPYVFFDEFFILGTFINAYDTTNEAQDAVVAAIMGEIPLRNTKAFNIIPKDLREYEKI